MPGSNTASPSPLRFASQRALETWLRKNHAKSDGEWLLISRQGAAGQTVTYAQAVEAALCFGWIDGQKKAFDARHFLQRFTPRRARSVWSKINRAKAEALIQSGRMQASGLLEVEKAKADGRWDAAYDGAATAVVPDDLDLALRAQPSAQAFFGTLDASNRYAVLWRVQTAPRPETRARRIEALVAMLARGEKIHG